MLVSFTLLTLGRRLLKCNGSCDMQRLGPENETAPRRGLFDQSDLWSHMQMRWVGVGRRPSDDGGEYTTRYAPVKRNAAWDFRRPSRASGGSNRVAPVAQHRWLASSGDAPDGGTIPGNRTPASELAGACKFCSQPAGDLLCCGQLIQTRLHCSERALRGNNAAGRSRRGRGAWM